MTISALLGVNAADDRGNIMFGIERDTRAKQCHGNATGASRTMRIRPPRAAVSPSAARPGGTTSRSRTRGRTRTSIPAQSGVRAINPPNRFPATIRRTPPSIRGGPRLTNPTTVANNPTQAAVNRSSTPASSACPNPNPFVTDAAVVPHLEQPAPPSRFSTEQGRHGLYGLGRRLRPWLPARTASTVRYTTHPTNPAGGDFDGDFQGLPVFVRQPNGAHQGKHPLRLGVLAARAPLGVRERPFRHLRHRQGHGAGHGHAHPDASRASG